MISKRQIIEKAISILKEQNMVPYSEESLYKEKFRLERIEEDDLEDPEPFLFNDALVYLFASFWAIINEIFWVTGSLGMPVYKYDFLKNKLTPLTFSQLYYSLYLLDEDEIKKVLSIDGVEHFNSLYNHFKCNNRLLFENYCQDNKIGKCCVEIFSYLFAKESKQSTFFMNQTIVQNLLRLFFQ